MSTHSPMMLRKTRARMMANSSREADDRFMLGKQEYGIGSPVGKLRCCCCCCCCAPHALRCVRAVIIGEEHIDCTSLGLPSHTLICDNAIAGSRTHFASCASGLHCRRGAVLPSSSRPAHSCVVASQFRPVKGWVCRTADLSADGAAGETPEKRIPCCERIDRSRAIQKGVSAGTVLLA